MENKIESVHPGKLLLTEITKQNMKQKELAIRTGVSEKHISTVINGTKDISAAFARKLDIALGSQSGTWAKYQADYDEYIAEVEEKSGITNDEINIFKGMKEIVEHFLDTGIMHNHCGDVEKIIQLRKVLCINSLTVIPQITYNAAYRAQVSTSTNIDPYILFAWQKMCEIETRDISVSVPFSSYELLNKIPDIKRQMFKKDPDKAVSALKKIFAECGIAFNVVRHFRGAPVQGFIRQTDSGKVILCVTLRGKGADIFWFSLFHEIGHLINGDLNTRFIDFETVNTEMENEADRFARDTLIDPYQYRAFIGSGNYHTLDGIKAFSQQAGIPYWITIGRLHKDGWIEWSRFAHETPKFGWRKEQR